MPSAPLDIAGVAVSPDPSIGGERVASAQVFERPGAARPRRRGPARTRRGGDRRGAGRVPGVERAPGSRAQADPRPLRRREQRGEFRRAIGAGEDSDLIAGCARLRERIAAAKPDVTIRGPHYVIADLARRITLVAGDVMLMGTPCQSRSIDADDVVEGEIGGIGRVAGTATAIDAARASALAFDERVPERLKDNLRRAQQQEKT